MAHFKVITYQFKSRLDFEKTAEAVLELLSQVDWLVLNDEAEQPLRIPTVGDIYSINFVNPPPGKSRWAGEIRLHNLDKFGTLVEYVENNANFHDFFEILEENLKAD